MEGKRNTNLFHKIKEGDEAAYNEAFGIYYPSLCYFADKFLKDWDESRSLVQQVFVDLWIKRGQLKIEHQFRAYLFQSVQHASLDYLKHKKVELNFLNSRKDWNYAVDKDLLEEAELNDRINRSIQKLPEKCRVIFLMSRFEELKYAEIAAKLNISVKTVEMQMGIALKRLRDSLSDLSPMQLMFIFSAKFKNINTLEPF
jgi:RNA polymerase sigma-70 factor (ECF subfamily)